MSRELEKIKSFVDKALKMRLKALKNMGVIKTVSVGKLDILKARGRIQGEIARSTNPDKELFQAISILSAVINVQHAQELIETQGVQTFNKYVARLRKKKTKAAKSLIWDDNFGVTFTRVSIDNWEIIFFFRSFKDFNPFFIFHSLNFYLHTNNLANIPFLSRHRSFREIML